MYWDYVGIKKNIEHIHPPAPHLTFKPTSLRCLMEAVATATAAAKTATTAKTAVGMKAAAVTLVAAAELAAVATTTTAVTTVATMAAIVMAAATVTATAVGDVNGGNSDGQGHRQQWREAQTTIN
jgi:hypothetical protein